MNFLGGGGGGKRPVGTFPKINAFWDDGARLLASPHSGTPRVAGAPLPAPDSLPYVHGRIEALVGVGVPRALGEALGKGHGDDDELVFEPRAAERHDAGGD